MCAATYLYIRCKTSATLMHVYMSLHSLCVTPSVCRDTSHTMYVAHLMSVAAGRVRRQKEQGLLRVGERRRAGVEYHFQKN